MTNPPPRPDSKSTTFKKSQGKSGRARKTPPKTTALTDAQLDSRDLQEVERRLADPNETPGLFQPSH